MGRRLHFWIFAAVLLLAPLPFGANRPWSAALLALLTGLLCLTWPLATIGDRALQPWPLRRIAGPASLFVIVVAWALLQASPWLPLGWAHPFWSEVSAGLGPSGPAVIPRVALAPEAATAATMRWLAYAGIFWLALQHGRSHRRARLLVEALALAGGLYAAYGLVVYFSGREMILGIPKWAYRGDLTATFVNRNSYAAYAGLGLLCAAAALHRRLRDSRGDLPALVNHLRRPSVFFMAAAAAIVVALPLSGSRAGLVVSVGGLVVFVGALLLGRLAPDARPKAILGLAVAVVVLAGAFGGLVFWLGPTADDAEARLRIYRIALEMIERRPWIGIGLGGFGPEFAMDRPFTISQVWTEVHNGYLELAVELGVPAAVIFVAAIAWLVVLSLRGVLVRQRDGMFPALALAASALLGAHALVDFSGQIPAIAATWAALLGLGVAQGWRHAD
ncbi:MAG: O-antigen ligase family protein [Ferrovibrionaceae bacterium]